MKPTPNRFLAISFLAAFTSSVSAALLFKDSIGTDINDLANWSTVNGAATPDPESFGTADQLRFNENTAATGTFTMDLSAALSVGNLTVDSGTLGGGIATGNFVIDSASNSTLTLNSGGNASYPTSGIVLNSGTGGTLTVNADIALGATPVRFTVSRALTVNGDIALGSNTLEFNTAGSTTTLSGVISGSGGLLKAAGGQILALNNTANTFSGGVVLVGGTTQVTKLANGGLDSSIGNGSGNIVLNGASLTFTGSGTDTTNRVIEMRAGAAINNTGTGTINFTAANVSQTLAATARTLTLGGSNALDNTFSSILGDSGTGTNISRLQKSGLGKWIVTGTHNYTGATIINQGTLVVSGSGVLGGLAGSAVDESNIWFTSTNSNAALHFETVANLGPASQIRFRNTGGTAGSGGALVYTGTTEQTLSKTIQCDTSIGIRLESNSVGGKLAFDGAFDQSNRRIYLGGTGIGENTLATGFAGNGGITKRGSGTWILTGTNTYTGNTVVDDGTLAVNASGSLRFRPTTNGVTNAVSGSATATLTFTGTLSLDLGAAAAAPGNSWNLFNTSSFTGPTLTPAAVTTTTLGSFTETSSGSGVWELPVTGAKWVFTTADGNLAYTATGGFSSWAATNGTAGTIDQDHDNDGVSNGIEYFIGGPTGNTTGFTALPGVTNTGGTLSVTWTKAASYAGTYGTHFTVETSDTLEAGSWSQASTSGTPATSNTVYLLDGNNVTYTFPAGTRKFARLTVTGP